ncbi:MAG TPA: glycosyltransferase family 39 protein [Burkholderiales bacterium]|jgi:4-amino-4-deoxy-L-arabinose transferase-like glycosyltransferase
MLKESSPQRLPLISASLDPPGPSRALLRPPERWLAPLAVGWFALVATALWLRPLWPVDETRYLSVAWEMWLRGDFLVPYLNGTPYSHKPPLLFWLMQAGWALFGVNEWWPRAVAPLFALASLFLTALLGRRIWRQHAERGVTAAWILFGSLLFAAFATLTMFDVLLASFVLLGVHGVVRASQGQVVRGFAQLGAAVGLGALTKGPVILLHLLPVALLAPWWMAHPRPALARWYAGVVVAALLGAGIVLTWALPAGTAGGSAYRDAILWGQTAGRMADSFAHRHVWWWYLPMLPAILFPWLLWPALWRALNRLRMAPSDPGVRLLLAWTVPAFIGFSLISGKQPHYLLPLVPGFALLAAHALHASGRVDLLNRVRMLAAVSPALVFAINAGIVRYVGADHDLHPIGDHLRALQRSGVPIAHIGRYLGQFHFVGRLTQPIEVVELDQVQRWVESHPCGRVIGYSDVAPAHAAQGSAADSPSMRRHALGEPEFSQGYRRRRVFVWGPGPVCAVDAAR